MVQWQNVWMVKSRRDSDLTKESVGSERCGQVRTKHLERHITVVLDVFREIYGRHVAGTDLANDRVAVRHRGGQPGVDVSHMRTMARAGLC